MRIYSDISIKDFDFWQGGYDTASAFTDDEMEAIETELEIEYPDGIDETELNDLFWHEPDYVANLAGYSCFENVKAGIKSDEENDVYDEAYLDDEAYESEKEDRMWRKYEREQE